MNKTRALEKEEVYRLFNCIEGAFANRNRTLLICGISMALRATELVSLKVGDVLDKNNQVRAYVTICAETAKRKKGRTLRIGEGVRSAIADFITDKQANDESLLPDAPLFVSRQGGHMTRQTLFALTRKIFNQAGVDESCHSLRKTGATAYYVQSTYDLLATQAFLGHSDPATTREYIGLDTAKLIEYSESLSDFLFSSIRGEFDTTRDLTNSLKVASDNDLLIELHQRGYDISPFLEKQRKQQLRQATVVSITTPSRHTSEHSASKRRRNEIVMSNSF